MTWLIRTVALLGLTLGGTVGAQVLNLSTTFSSNNGQSGNMFDVVAINTLTICGLDVSLDPGVWDIRIYTVTGGGTWVGKEQTPSAWTLVGTSNGVSSVGLNVPTPVPINLAVVMLAGTTRGVYVTATNGAAVNYTNGTVMGTVAAQDANLQCLEGAGNVYPFGLFSEPRIWNGTIHYTLGAVCPPLAFQTNSPQARLDFDGVTSNGFLGAERLAVIGETIIATSHGSNFFEVAIAGSPLIPNGAVTPGGQVLNVDLFDPLTQFFNGGVVAVPALHPGTIVLPLASFDPIVVSAQQSSTDPSQLDGYRFSQACQLTVRLDQQLQPGDPTCNPAGTVLALGDDTFLQQSLGFGFPFYGTTFTEVFVGSNGHATFGGGIAGWASDPTTFTLTGVPMIAPLSTDLNPFFTGEVRFFTDGVGAFEVCWCDVPSFNSSDRNTARLTAWAGLIQFDYGAVEGGEGLVGLSQGIGEPAQILDLSTAGGMNGPLALLPGRTPVQLFSNDAFDLNGLQVSWGLDSGGFPISVQ